MTNENKIFLPVFYNSLDLTENLSDEEFGILLRELLRSRGERGYSANLPRHLKLAYNFMLDNAIRIFNGGVKLRMEKAVKFAPRKNGGSEQRERSFDVDDAFKKALARTYGQKGEEQ